MPYITRSTPIEWCDLFMKSYCRFGISHFYICWIILSPRGRHKANEKSEKEREKGSIGDRAREARKIIGRWHFKLYLYRNAHTEHRNERWNEMKRDDTASMCIDTEMKTHQHTNWSRDRAKFVSHFYLPSFLINTGFSFYRLFVCLFVLLINLLHLFAQNFLVFWWLDSTTCDQFSLLFFPFLFYFVCKFSFLIIFFFFSSLVGKILCSVYDSDWLCWCVDRFYLIEYKYKTMK